LWIYLAGSAGAVNGTGTVSNSIDVSIEIGNILVDIPSIRRIIVEIRRAGSVATPYQPLTRPNKTTAQQTYLYKRQKKVLFLGLILRDRTRLLKLEGMFTGWG